MNDRDKLFTYCKHPTQPMEAQADLCWDCLPQLGFVEVKPCEEHGRLDRHKVRSDGIGDAYWCEGAALGEPA